MPVYILNKLMVTSTHQPTDQPTGRIQGNLPFRMLENRKKAEICKKCIICKVGRPTSFNFIREYIFSNVICRLVQLYLYCILLANQFERLPDISVYEVQPIISYKTISSSSYFIVLLILPRFTISYDGYIPVPLILVGISVTDEALL